MSRREKTTAILAGAGALLALGITFWPSCEGCDPQKSHAEQTAPAEELEKGRKRTASAALDTASPDEPAEPVEMPSCAQNMEFPTTGNNSEHYDALKDCKAGLKTPEQIAEFDRLSQIAFENYEAATIADEAYLRELQEELRSEIKEELEAYGFKEEHFAQNEFPQHPGQIVVTDFPEIFGDMPIGVTISVSVPQMSQDGDASYHAEMRYMDTRGEYAHFERETYDGQDQKALMQELLHDFTGI
jgi:hypothetical protein